MASTEQIGPGTERYTSQGAPNTTNDDRLTRLAHAATRLHLALRNRPALRSMPVSTFQNRDGSSESYPMLRPDEFADTLEPGEQRAYHDALSNHNVGNRRAA